MRRRGSRTRPDPPGQAWMAVDCCTDGYRHQVPADMAGRDLARVGRVIARCGHVVTGASLTAAPRPCCALCFTSTTV